MNGWSGSIGSTGEIAKKCRDYARKVERRDAESLKEIRSLQWKVRNAGVKESCLAQSLLRTKYGVHVLRPDQVREMVGDRKRAVENVCAALDRFLIRREEEMTADGGVPDEAREAIDLLREDMKILRRMSL